MSDEDTRASDTADQNEGAGDDLENQDDTDTSSDDDAQDDSQDDSSDDAQDDAQDDAADDAEQRFKDQQGRAKKAEKERDGYKQRLVDAGLDPDTGKPKESRAPNKDGKALSDADSERIARAEDRAERAELRAMGISHADDIQFVRDAAKRLGVDPAEAATDELVAGKLERMQAARKTKDATPSPSKRGGGGNGGDNIARLADKVEKGGDLPADSALAEKVQAEIARRAQQRA